MAIVNVSLDTGSRQVILTINGVLVTATNINIHKYIFDDGEVDIGFSYTVENVDGNGLKERRQFYLPSLTEAAEVKGGLDKDGFASKIVHDDEKAKTDTIDYLNKLRRS